MYRTDVVNEEVPKDMVNTPIYNYASSNYKPCSWSQLGEKFFRNEKNISSPNFVMNDMLFCDIYACTVNVKRVF